MWNLGHFGEQGTFTPVGAQGGTGSMEPPLRNHFLSGVLQWNLHHICMHHQKL